MKFPGSSSRIIGMCYDVSESGDTSFGRGPNSLMLRVPFIAQQHVNLCSDATALMILQAWGFATNTTTDENPRGIVTGANVTDHVNFAVKGKTAWSEKGRTDSPDNARGYADLLIKKGPIACSMKTIIGGHCIVLIGAYSDSGQVVVHDPWKGPRIVKNIDEFNGSLESIAWPTIVGGDLLSSDDAKWSK